MPAVLAWHVGPNPSCENKRTEYIAVASGTNINHHEPAATDCCPKTRLPDAAVTDSGQSLSLSAISAVTDSDNAISACPQVGKPKYTAQCACQRPIILAAAGYTVPVLFFSF